MSFEAISNFNKLLAFGAVALQVLSVLALLLLFFGKKKNKFLDFIDKKFLAIGFFLSFTGTVFSLIYSEVIGFAPCYLCWLARIFLYPQVVLFGIALWVKDRKVIRYVTPLLFGGFLVAIYHNLRYYFADTGNLPCDASGISCYQQLVSEFGGYISIPMLSLTSIFAVFTVVVVAHFYGKRD